MKRKRGVTVLELVIATGIFLMVASLSFSIIGTGRLSWEVISAQLFLRMQAQQALNAITQDLNKASTIRVFADAGSWPGPVSSFHFSVPTIDADDALVLSPGGEARWGDGSPAGVGNFIKYTFAIGVTGSTGTLVRQVLAPNLSVVSQRTVARAVRSFQVSRPVTGNGRYDIQMSFFLSTYGGFSLPTAVRYPPVVTDSIGVSVTPEN